MKFALSEMSLRSPAFQAGAAIPKRFTGEGEDLSPPLEWSDPPDGTGSFAVICHDPDAPVVHPGSYGFVHWVLANIPGTERALPEAAVGHTPGSNDFGNEGYGGPMPPEGHGRHHYFFWVLALEGEPKFERGVTMAELLREVEDGVLGMNRLVGTYERS